jgi:hypothetical protein
VTSVTERARVRAYYETACAECGGPCWGRGVPGRRCKECVHLNAKRITLPDGTTRRTDAKHAGLRYQWGCP